MISNHSLIFNTIIIQKTTQRKITYILAVNQVVAQLSTKIYNFQHRRRHPLASDLSSSIPILPDPPS